MGWPVAVPSIAPLPTKLPTAILTLLNGRPQPLDQAMNSISVRFSIVGAIVIASVAAPLLIQGHARIQWREREALLRQQAGQFAELSAQNKRLSKLVAQTNSSCLSSDQFSELMKLRGEIGRLRQEASEAARVRATNRHLLAASTNSEPESEPSLPDPQTVLAYWPKTQLTSAGYADPTSGLQTTLWAMSRNDPNALVTSVTPEARSELTNGAQITALWVVSRNDPDVLAGRVAPETKYGALMDHLSPAERMAFQAKGAADSLGLTSGFYVVGQKLTSQDQAILDVYFDGEGATRRFALSKIGDDWKVGGIYLAGGQDDRPYGPKLWP